MIFNYLNVLVITLTTAEEGKHAPAHNKKQDRGENLFTYKSSSVHCVVATHSFLTYYSGIINAIL